MSLPSGTAQAEEIKLRKTCRGCKQPLYDGGQDEQFAVAGIGIMHLECARRFCSEKGIELNEAVPICKHWHIKGHCIYQDKCRNRHPPDARGVGKRVAAQCTSSKQDRAATWRLHNSIIQGQQLASVCSRPALLQACKGRLNSQPCTLHADQAAASQPETPSSPLSALAQASGLGRDAHQLPHGHQGSPRQVATGVCRSAEDSAQSLACGLLHSEALDTLHDADSYASTPARKKLSYARLGPAGATSTQAASSACSADLDSSGPRRFKIHNRFRAGIFRRFLIDTFGREVMARGSGILDIGGGRGELAFELLNLNNIRAIIVDPRPGSLSKQAKWLKTGFYHRNAVYQAYVDRPLSHFAAREAEMPRSLRVVLSAELCDSLAARHPADAADAELPPLLQRAFCEALSDRWMHHGADHEERGPSRAALGRQRPGQASDPASRPCSVQSAHSNGLVAALSIIEHGSPHQSAELYSGEKARAIDSMTAEAVRLGPAEIPMQSSMQLAIELKPASSSVNQHNWEPDCQAGVAMPPSGAESRNGGLDEDVVAETRSLFQDASVLVGMHPDQATEHIVGMAQQLRKPFAVVPCCVHARDFPQRRLPGGGPVRTHEDLVAYIVGKDPLAIQVAELSFEGRNTVVFCRQWSSRV